MAAGFEHSVAGMSVIPVARFVNAFAGAEFWAGVSADPEAFDALGAAGFLRNLPFSTLGNILGGGRVGLAYWYVPLRDGPAPRKD